MAPLVELLRALAPDVLHVHGLGFHREVASLGDARPRNADCAAGSRQPTATVVASGSMAARPVVRRRGRILRGEQARPLALRACLSPHTRVYGIPESTTRFVPGDRRKPARDRRPA